MTRKLFLFSEENIPSFSNIMSFSSVKNVQFEDFKVLTLSEFLDLKNRNGNFDGVKEKETSCDQHSTNLDGFLFELVQRDENQENEIQENDNKNSYNEEWGCMDFMDSDRECYDSEEEKYTSDRWWRELKSGGDDSRNMWGEWN